jgi:hypothetical protein
MVRGARRPQGRTPRLPSETHTTSQSAQKYLRVNINPLINFCVTWTDPADMTMSIRMIAFALG